MSLYLDSSIKCVLVTPFNDDGAPLIDYYFSDYAKLDDAKFKTFTIENSEYDFLYTSYNVNGDKLNGLLIFKHMENGYFYDMNVQDFNRIADYFISKSIYEHFVSDYDFLPYSSLHQKYYEVAIKELLEKVVEVQASNFNSALDKVIKMYKNGDVVLDADDFVDKDFRPVSDEPDLRYVYVSEVDFETLENGKSANILLPSHDGSMKWENTSNISNFSLDDRFFKIYGFNQIVFTNNIDLIINNESDYVICKDQQTKDWYVYNNKTDKDECIDGQTIYFNNEFEAKEWCMNKITKGDYEIAQEYLKKNKAKTR